MIDMNLTTALERIHALELEIAKHKQREIKLSESEEKYKQLFESSRDALMTLSPPSWKFTNANKAALVLFKVGSVTDFTALGPWELSPQKQPDGRYSIEKAQEMITIAMRDGSNFFEWQHNTIDGKVFTADVLLTRLEFDGQILVQATVRDIGDKKKIEEKLRRERDFSTRLIENVPAVIIILDKQGKIIRFNKYIEKLTGYSMDEVKGKDWFSTFIPQNQREKTKKVFLNAMNDIQTNGNVNLILTKNGMPKVIEWFNKTLKDIKNNTIGIISIGVDITERLEKEKTYKLFRMILDKSSDSIQIIEPSTFRFLDVNDTLCQNLGYSREELLTMSIYDIDPDLNPNHANEIQQRICQEKFIQIEGIQRRKNGSTFPVEINSTLVELDKPYILCISHDITERKLSETLQCESEEKYRAIFEGALDGIGLIDMATKRFIDANKALCGMLGYSYEELITLNVLDIHPKENLQYVLEQFKKHAKGKIELATDIPVQRKDGSIFFTDINATNLNFSGKNYMVGILRDITQRKQEEKQLRALRIMIDRSNDAIFILNKYGMFLDVNKEACRSLGYTKEELLKIGIKDVSEDNPPFEEVMDYIMQNKSTTFESFHIRKDSSKFRVEINVGAETTMDDKKTIAVARDITERQRTNQILRESEEKFRSITASAQDAIIMMDNDGKISYWNEAAEKIFGYTEEEAIGRILHTFITPERFLEAHKIGFKHFKKTGEGVAIGKTLELVALKKDGTEFPIELSLSATMIDGFWIAIGIIRDITERKEMQIELKLKEEMMLAQSKQAAMGEMIAMIAHQWRQPLATISMDVNNLSASIALEEEITTDDLIKYTDAIYEQLDQLSETIDNFRNFFKPEQLKETTSIEDTLKSTLNIIGTSLISKNISVNIKNTTKSSLFMNKTSLIQVLLNVIGNAKDMLATKEVVQGAIDITAYEDKETITISICDNAGGIPESIMQKIGQPYFTTKQELNGTGLGLYISKTIMEKHLFGTFRWHNEDKGACFVITLNIKHNT